MILDMRADLQDIAEQILIFVARAALGLFLAVILGVGPYIVLVIPVVHSIWEVKDINFGLVAVLAIGFGTGVGSFLAWLDRDLARPAMLLMLLLAIAFSIIGAWIGLHESRDVYKLVGNPGSPALTGIAVGAMIGGNAINLPFWILKAVRSPRL